MHIHKRNKQINFSDISLSSRINYNRPIHLSFLFHFIYTISHHALGEGVQNEIDDGRKCNYIAVSLVPHLVCFKLHFFFFSCLFSTFSLCANILLSSSDRVRKISLKQNYSKWEFFFRSLKRLHNILLYA